MKFCKSVQTDNIIFINKSCKLLILLRKRGWGQNGKLWNLFLGIIMNYFQVFDY
jgi:hypothetical protein